MNPKTAGGLHPRLIKVRQQQTGSSLLEVLVAILLVSVGLLGIAGLSGATFGYNKTSQIRLVGMALVNDYADRARVNIFGFDLNQYTLALGDAVPTDTLSYDEDLDTKIAANAITAAQDVAKFDRQDFLIAVADRLPSGTAVVVSNRAASARGMDVWLLWKEPQAEATDTLFGAAQQNCPSNLSDDDKAVYSCMYFKVGL